MRHLLVLGLLLVCRPAFPQDPATVWTVDIGPLRYFPVLVDEIDEAAEWYSHTFGLDRLDDTSADDGSWRIINLSNERGLLN